jgi:hypothetical protein
MIDKPWPEDRPEPVQPSPFSFIIYGVLSAIAFAGFAFFGTNILVALGVGV